MFDDHQKDPTVHDRYNTHSNAIIKIEQQNINQGSLTHHYGRFIILYHHNKYSQLLLHVKIYNRLRQLQVASYIEKYKVYKDTSRWQRQEQCCGRYNMVRQVQTILQSTMSFMFQTYQYDFYYHSNGPNSQTMYSSIDKAHCLLCTKTNDNFSTTRIHTIRCSHGNHLRIQVVYYQMLDPQNIISMLTSPRQKLMWSESIM